MGNQNTKDIPDVPIIGKLWELENYRPIGPIGKFDWLAHSSEYGQTVNAHYHSRPNKPDSIRNILYLAIEKEFPELSEIREYLSIFFNLEVRIFTIDLTEFSGKIRENQYNTREFVRVLRTKIPSDAFAVMAIINSDIYSPGLFRDSAFVYGESSYYGRAGVCSLYRFTSEFNTIALQSSLNDIKFHPEKYAKQDTTELVDVLMNLNKQFGDRSFLNRACKLLTHEIGHMFGFDHCITHNCNMCGFNMLPELDRWSALYCGVCMQKLYLSMPNVNWVERQNKLVQFYLKHNMTVDYEFASTLVD